METDIRVYSNDKPVLVNIIGIRPKIIASSPIVLFAKYVTLHFASSLRIASNKQHFSEIIFIPKKKNFLVNTPLWEYSHFPSSPHIPQTSDVTNVLPSKKAKHKKDFMLPDSPVNEFNHGPI
ncbi:hypothetical protein BC937DRAFT_92148 [Endogone sp. FLAS-F59071]|nr:hypothetical protein BC937DRAFT_92148 [Endogone sp. FLAS-F59071]|eukprot:RUS15673.1 hypothetical protein BC937DRAFT_92148 [Endogone sp. FLAS-F59071]